MTTIGVLRLCRMRNKPRLRTAVTIFIICSLLYQFLPLLLYKKSSTNISWKDADFHQAIKKAKEMEDGLKGFSKKEIIILRWTAYFREYDDVKILSPEKCSSLETGTTHQTASKVFKVPCRVTFDRRYLNKSDALLFHSYDLMWEELTEGPRNRNRLWIYLQQESPIYTKLNIQAYPNIFNWTMTYRRDSEVYHPYGHFVQRTRTSDFANGSLLGVKNPNKVLKAKIRLVAWIVSSCDSHSKREYFVQELQKYINIDIFGWCGQDCPSKFKDCYEYVGLTHKFYLSFENSLCTDYITEKFFKAFKTNMVPVVYGGTQGQDYSGIAPNHSYIDSRNFKSPKDLANYLQYLDQNDDEYLKYFEWKSKFEVLSSHMGWCNLCQRVYDHLQTAPSPEHKWYSDLWRWWNYMSYDTSVVIDEMSAPSQMNLIGQSYYYKLGAPACIPPPKKLINEGTITKPDFEPSLLNGKIHKKVIGWMKEKLFQNWKYLV